MAKKKKSKKEKTDVPSLSNLERAILLLTIKNLNSKIEWRKEQNEKIRDDIEHYQNIFKEEHEDRKKSIGLLEKAIQEKIDIYQKIKVAIPDANNSLLKTERDNSYDSAKDLIKLNEETEFQEGQLQALRKNLMELETYNVEHVDEKISEIEKELSAARKRDHRQGLILDKSLNTILQKELQHTFEQKITSYQDDLSSNVSSNLMRIAEETRWWENSASILLNKKKILEQIIASKEAEIKKLKQDVIFYGENCLKDSVQLHDLKKKMVIMKTQILKLHQTQREKTEMKNESIYLNTFIEEYIRESDRQQQGLMKINEDQKEDEAFIKDLEMKLSHENDYGLILSEAINKALKLIKEEVKHSLLKSYAEFVEKKSVFAELDVLLMKATKLIYENKL